MSILSKAYFHNEAAAYEHLESIIWARGVVCPKCGVIDRSGKLKGKTARAGLRKCYACRKQFTVTVGTVFESSHIPLNKWLQAAYLISSSKKGISTHQIHRTLEITYKSAWFMTHRLREAMRELNIEVMGGVVEADETYCGGLDKNRHRNKRKGVTGGSAKEAVFSLVERGGKVRSTHVSHVTAENLRPILNAQLSSDARLMTDEARHFLPLGKNFAAHGVVQHSIGEYVKGDAHTNTIEGYFSIFKRGMKGVYQHCSADHLKRYLCEFDFRYNQRDVTDAERFALTLQGIQGKRLTYAGAC